MLLVGASLAVAMFLAVAAAQVLLREEFGVITVMSLAIFLAGLSIPLLRMVHAYAATKPPEEVDPHQAPRDPRDSSIGVLRSVSARPQPKEEKRNIVLERQSRVSSMLQWNSGGVLSGTFAVVLGGFTATQVSEGKALRQLGFALIAAAVAAAAASLYVLPVLVLHVGPSRVRDAGLLKVLRWQARTWQLLAWRCCRCCRCCRFAGGSTQEEEAEGFSAAAVVGRPS